GRGDRRPRAVRLGAVDAVPARRATHERCSAPNPVGEPRSWRPHARGHTCAGGGRVWSRSAGGRLVAELATAGRLGALAGSGLSDDSRHGWSSDPRKNAWTT